MARIPSLVIVALLITGCSHGLSPSDTRRILEERERQWKATIASRYDLDALSSFLRQTIAEKKDWLNVDVASARVGSSWTVGGGSMITGDWYFQTLDPTRDEFTLGTHYRHKKAGLEFRCVREAKNRFRVAEVALRELREELVI